MPTLSVLKQADQMMFIAFDKVQILLQNVDQIKAIISATFGSHLWHDILEDDCRAPGSDAEELACEYKTMMTSAGRATAHGDVDLSLSTISKVWLPDSPLSFSAKSCLVVTKSPRRHE
jgi:hypothetical protein